MLSRFYLFPFVLIYSMGAFAHHSPSHRTVLGVPGATNRVHSASSTTLSLDHIVSFEDELGMSTENQLQMTSQIKGWLLDLSMILSPRDDDKLERQAALVGPLSLSMGYTFMLTNNRWHYVGGSYTSQKWLYPLNEVIDRGLSFSRVQWAYGAQFQRSGIWGGLGLGRGMISGAYEATLLGGFFWTTRADDVLTVTPSLAYQHWFSNDKGRWTASADARYSIRVSDNTRLAGTAGVTNDFKVVRFGVGVLVALGAPIPEIREWEPESDCDCGAEH